MEPQIAADWPLDFVKFQILPQNRYETFICSNEEEEMVGDGPVDQLLEHLPSKKNQLAQGSCDNFKLELPETHDNRAWFTKATLMRFLQMVGSCDLLKKCVAISDEMSQLDEARKFHLSLYAQAEDGITTSDNSKNELLRAMDSRLAALTEELVSTFKLAVGDTLSLQEMLDLHKFCHHFGDVDVRNMSSKLSEASRKIFTDVPVDRKKSPVPFISKDDYVKKTGGNIQVSGSSDLNKPVKYSASPAKAAEMERQSSSECEDSSFSSEDDQPSAERSRTFIRSATPRRSASPMRRIQIGRSGSRRTPALTIKSLTHFPARERVLSYRDTGNDNLEESEELNKETEVNVTRMSVQDAISLFESKQKDQIVDNQKKSLIDNCTNANKTVLRRWSAGMGDARNILAQHLPENIASEDNAKVVDEDAPESNARRTNEDQAFENPESEKTLEVDMEPEANEKIASSRNGDDVPVSQAEETNEKLDSAEWSRQKEAELNQMLMKFTEYNQINLKNAKPDNRRKSSSLVERKSSSLVERRGGLYGHSKDRKDEKLRGENDVKEVVKLAEIKAKQKIPHKPKAERSALKVSDVAKKNITSKIQNVNKTMPLVSNSKKESPKPVVTKKGPPKSSPLPATRKSWPSTPSPRATGAIPAKIPSGTPPSRTTAPRQKPQSPASLSKPTPQSERSQLQQKDVKKPQVDTAKSLKKVDDSKSRVVPKSGRMPKPKPVVAPKEDAGSCPAKPVVRRKVTKKSSVVPLEAKAEDHKVSGIRPTGKPTSQKIEVSQPEETSEKPEEPMTDSPKNVGATISDTAHLVEGDPVLEAWNDHHVLEKEMEREKLRNDGENDISKEAPAQVDEIAERISESPGEVQPTEPPFISPAAWVESNEQEPSIPNGKSSAPSPASHDVEASPGVRVRHSLSQMLLEESSEPDVIEWGNAENPPTMVYQKDAPKGLKRLLKFARKNKGESNASFWSSPYASEGEDDGDEYKSVGKRNSDNLLKVALHSKNYAEGFLSDSEPLSARSNVSNSSARSSKGSRSFFSLSAFRGSKN